MNTIKTFTAIALATALTACGPSAEDDEADGIETVDLEGMPGDPTPPPPPPFEGSADEPNDGNPDLTPAPLTPEAEQGETGARNVLLSFARAIEMQETDQAYAMLSAAAQDRWDAPSFAAIFDGVEDITAAVPDGRLEGAAGSSYYESHATITAQDSDGRPVRLEGPVVLRRVNDVPGASERSLRWQVESLDLSQTH